MRFMVIVYPGNRYGYEAGQMPDERLLHNMAKFNEALVEAGVILGGDGLQPTSKGMRIHFAGSGKRTVIDGPFTETKDVVGGFWIWKVKSKEEALLWANRAPMEDGATLELRQLFEPEDFGPEIEKQEKELIKKIGKQAGRD